MIDELDLAIVTAEMNGFLGTRDALQEIREQYLVHLLKAELSLPTGHCATSVATSTRLARPETDLASATARR